MCPSSIPSSVFNCLLPVCLPCLEAETPISDNPHPRRTSAPLRETSPIRAERSPSPSTHPESEVLHVKNLVRPFTLNQLKELLGKHGSLAEDGFWIDKIKSHCYVVVRSVRKKSLTCADIFISTYCLFSLLHNNRPLQGFFNFWMEPVSENPSKGWKEARIMILF